jgi:predicted transposase YbfD/YdcC
MKIKTLTLTVLIALGSFSSFGCGGEDAARQVALQLRASVIEDEKLIDANIATQTAFYEKQRAEIEKSRVGQLMPQPDGDPVLVPGAIVFRLDGERRLRSAEAATAMSLDPGQEARLSNLMHYLLETNDSEYELWNKLYEDDQKAREDLKSKIAKLQRQKKVLTQVKENLNQLALAPNRKKRARALLLFSQETFVALKKSGK